GRGRRRGTPPQPAAPAAAGLRADRHHAGRAGHHRRLGRGLAGRRGHRRFHARGQLRGGRGGAAYHRPPARVRGRPVRRAGRAPAVRWLGRVLGPLARVLILIGNAFTPGRGFREGPFATTVELRELVDLAEERGVVEHGEREMIHSVFSLGDTIVREVMVPRTEMVWIESDKTVRQALALFIRSGFSRIPVIGENVDDILGIVYLKDAVRSEPEMSVETLMRPATFVPESKHVDDMLSEMQAARTHIAVVVDEYGGTAGLVTIEDILEEIVGEITDEYDIERPPVERLPDGSVRISARLSVADLEALFDVELP